MEVFFNLTWLIPLPPLIAFFAIILFLNPRKRLSSGLAIGMVALSWIMCWLVAFAFFTNWRHLVEGRLQLRRRVLREDDQAVGRS